MPSRSIWCVCPSYCRFHHVRGVSSVVSLAVLISTSNRLGFGVSMIHLLLLLCNPYIISRVWLFVNFHCVRNGQRERKKREHKFEASHAAPHFGFIDNSREIKRKKKENNFFFPFEETGIVLLSLVLRNKPTKWRQSPSQTKHRSDFCLEFLIVLIRMAIRERSVMSRRL